MPKDTATQAVSVYAALRAAQAEMPPPLKDATNPHFKSKYADLGSVQEACLPYLRKHGFAVFQPVGRDEHGVHVKTILAHESGETLECSVPLLIGKNDMQGLGSAITYARRYGLLCMSGVAPEDDDGNASRPSPPDRNADIIDPAPPAEPSPEAWALTLINGSLTLEGHAVAKTQISEKFGGKAPRRIAEAWAKKQRALEDELAADFAGESNA